VIAEGKTRDIPVVPDSGSDYDPGLGECHSCGPSMVRTVERTNNQGNRGDRSYEWNGRSNVRASHDNTILVFASLSVRILAVWVSSQDRSGSTRLNDRGVRVRLQPLRRASISSLGGTFIPRDCPMVGMGPESQ